MFKESQKGIVLPEMGLGEDNFGSKMRGNVLLAAGFFLFDKLVRGGAFLTWLLEQLSAFL